MASNAKEIQEKLKTIMQPGGEVHDAVISGLRSACAHVAGEAKRKAPVKTANLRNSIQYDVKEEETTGYVGTNVPYAPYVEIGTGIYSSQGDGRQTPWIYVDPATGEKVFTRGSKPHPFLKPALDENIAAIIKKFENLI